MTEKIYILLPVHNRREITRKFIESLKAQTSSTYNLVLVDDGSSDGTADMVREYIPDATVLHGIGNWWWAGSLQQGMDWLRTQSLAPDDIVLFINDDSVIPADFLAKGSALLRGLPRTMLQACVHDINTGEVLDVGMVYDPKRLQFRTPEPGEQVNCLTTNGLFVRWSDLARVGGFHPRALPHYLSDYEFTIRAGRKGLALVVSRELNLLWNRQTTGSRTFNQETLPAFLRAYFSRRSAVNPFYWTSFVLLACPWRYLLRHVWRIWKSAFVTIAVKFIEIMKAGTARRNSQEK